MELKDTDKCWCDSGKNYQECHKTIDEKIATFASKGIELPRRDMIKNETEIEGIRASGKINIAILDAVAEVIKVGMTTGELDKFIYDKTIELGGIPAQLGYEGFPKSVCISINDQVCHGIPNDDEEFWDGDIVNVDVSTIYNGYFSDSARMFKLGEMGDRQLNIINTVEESVKLALEEVKPWVQMGIVSETVQTYVESKGYSVVEELGGHGVGLEFHEDPWVGFVGKRDEGVLLVPGMIFTIEPMINEGARDIFIDEEDGWTIYTEDGMLSAQVEHMVLVTEDGYELLAY